MKQGELRVPAIGWTAQQVVHNWGIWAVFTFLYSFLLLLRFFTLLRAFRITFNVASPFIFEQVAYVTEQLSGDTVQLLGTSDTGYWKTIAYAWFLWGALELLYAWVAAGGVKMALQAYQENVTHIMLISQVVHLSVYNLVATWLYYCVVALGLVCGVLPGIYFAVRFWFFQYALVENECLPLDALRYSWRLTSGHVISLGVFIFLLGIVLSGIKIFPGSVFFLIPFSFLMWSYYYFRL